MSHELEEITEGIGTDLTLSALVKQTIRDYKKFSGKPIDDARSHWYQKCQKRQYTAG